MAAKEFIVAIELGSSKMTGIAGKKNLDGSINVMAVVKEDASSFIHKGVVYNVDKTVQALRSIVGRLTAALKTEITQVYVGVGGQSIRSVKNVIPVDLAPDTKVTEKMVCDLMDTNRVMVYPDQEILGVAIQEYKVDHQFQADPVGIPCRHLEGHFLNILQRKAFYRNLNECFNTAGIEVAEWFLSPLALADSVLTEAEKRSGCVLVDLGADTTTVSVYSKNMLRHLAVIPLGGAHITKDIASLQIDEADAERLKIKYGNAYTDNNDINDKENYSIDGERSIESGLLLEIIEARLCEIIENVWAQVPAEYYDKLLGGIIVTGGSSNMKNIDKAFNMLTHIDKIRIAKTVNFNVNSSNADVNEQNAMMNTLLGLLAKGDENCAGGKADDTAKLFPEEPRLVNPRKEEPRQVGDTTPDVVISQKEREDAEKKKKEEEEAVKAHEKAIEDARRQDEEEEQKRREEEQKRNRVSIFSKIKTQFGGFIDTLTDKEEEEK